MQWRIVRMREHIQNAQHYGMDQLSLEPMSYFLKEADVVQETYISRCKRNQAASLSENIRHHFIYSDDMGLDQVIEYKDKWKGTEHPSKYYIKRYTKHNGIACRELSELYKCRDCNVYCWSSNRIIYPHFIFDRVANNGDTFSLLSE